MEEYLEIRLDIFDRLGQRAQVVKTLRMEELIEEILKEFDDIPADSPERYALYLKGSKKSLPREQTLAQADIQPQDELTLTYAARDDLREMLETARASLRDEKTGKEYMLEWTPAVIGRPTNSAEHNILLAVNFQHHPNGMSVSRRHAQVLMKDGRYFLESLTPTNPTVLNTKVLAPGQKAEIRHKDTLFFGKRVKMTFLLHSAPKIAPPPAREERDSTSTPVMTVEPLPAPSLEATVEPMTFESSEATRMDTDAPVLCLVIEKAGTHAGELIEFDDFPVSLGRSHPLLAGEKEASRQHVQFDYDPVAGQFTVQDMKSANGTFVDGERLTPETPRSLQPAMRLQLGPNVVLLVR